MGEGDERWVYSVEGTMTGGSLGLRTGSYGSLQQHNGFSNFQPTPILVRKSSKLLFSSSREKEKLRPLLCRFFGRRKVAMLLLVVLALFVFVFGSFIVNRGLFFFIIFYFGSGIGLFDVKMLKIVY